MEIVPVSDSTIDAKYLGKIIQNKYGLSVNTECKLFRTGINHSYMITDGSLQYVFRIYSYNWRTKEEILEELNLLISLKGKLSISFPIADRKQNIIQPFQAPEGVRYGALFSYAKGKKIRVLSTTMLEQIGEWMGTFHQKTAEQKLERIDYNANTLTTLPYSHAKIHFRESLEEMVYLKKVDQLIASTFEKAASYHFKKGIVHLDIWNDNMHIVDDGITVFDFDFCGNGYQVLDVAYFMTQLFHAEHNREVYESKVTTFLKKYESFNFLTKEEKEFIPYAGIAIWMFYLGVQSRRFDNWSNIFLTEIHLERFVGMIKGWAAYYKVKI